MHVRSVAASDTVAPTDDGAEPVATWDKEGVHPLVGFRFGGDDDRELGWDDDADSNVLWDRLRGNVA